MRGTLLLLSVLVAGCQSAPVGVVVMEPELGLTRGRYVLPPEPPPPEPRSVREQRRLEAEWPEVASYAVTTWPQAQERAERWRHTTPLPTCGPALPADMPCQGSTRASAPASAVQAARPIQARPVVIRVHDRRAATLPMILLEVR